MISDSNSSLVSKCLDLCQSLVDRGMAFSIQIKIDKDFAFSMDSKESFPVAQSSRKNSPSTLRRNARRKCEFLARKKSHQHENTNLTSNCHSANNVCLPLADVNLCKDVEQPVDTSIIRDLGSINGPEVAVSPSFADVVSRSLKSRAVSTITSTPSLSTSPQSSNSPSIPPPVQSLPLPIPTVTSTPTLPTSPHSSHSQSPLSKSQLVHDICIQTKPPISDKLLQDEMLVMMRMMQK